MKNYRTETHNFEQLDGLMTLPSYQRPLVWTEEQKANFIDNISKGFPFGSLLLYRDGANDQYTLIDGQQRYTTLKDYASNPEKYFPLEDSPIVDELMAVSGALEQPEAAQANLRSKYIGIIKEMIREQASGRQVPGSYLASEIMEVFPLAVQNNMKIVDIQGEIISALDDYIDLSNLDVPCVIFTGDKADLPEVFANVNLGGRKLTKYQVFAAQWDRYRIHLQVSEYSSQILDKTISRYEKLTEDRNGLVIEDFSPTEMKDNRTVTLPEFCHALGEMILENGKACWSKKAMKADDTVDTIGYNTLAIVFGISPKEIKNLPEAFASAGFENNEAGTENLLCAIMDEYEKINARFAKYLRRPGIKEQYETSKTGAQLQFLSFFAALWRLHYGAISSPTFEPIPGYKHKGYNASAENIFPSFIHDLLTNQWRGSGDTRLGNYVIGNLTYLMPVSKEKLQIAMSSYLEELNGSESVNVDPVAKTLLTVFANSQSGEYGAEKYDYEHLIPRDTLVKRHEGVPAYKAYKISGGGLGNIAYLDSTFNRAKGSKTFADAMSEMYTFDGAREEVDPNRLRRANLALLEGNPEEAKAFLRDRANAVASRIVDYVGSID